MRLRREQVAAMAHGHAARVLAEAFAAQHLTIEPTTTPNLIGLRDPEGARGFVELNSSGLIERYCYPSRRQFQMRYTPSHRLATLQLPSGLAATLSYDEADRLTDIDRAGQSFRLQYGPNNSICGAAYPDGTHERFDRNTEGALLGHVDRNGQTTQFTRDQSGRLTQLLDARGNATSFRYGAWQSPDSLLSPDGTEEELVRDASGQPSEARIAGQAIAKSTFASGRLASIVYADGEQVKIAYDDAGRIAVATVGDVTVSRAYDAEGRMVEERIGDQVVTACYAFDGQLELLTTNVGQVSFAYDGDRRLSRVQDWSGASQIFNYDGVDQSQLRELPGLREQRTLTPVGFTAQVVTHASPSGDLQMWQQYAHDANDRVVASNDSHLGQVNYQYDAEGQVLSALRANGEQRFAYDPVGNRVFGTGVLATFDNCNRMVENGAERLSYDLQGNLVLRETPAGATRYQFSTRNLLQAVVRPDGSRVEFEYDACGRRITKRIGERVTRYMWFGNHLLYEWLEGDAASRIDYLYRPGTHEPLAMRQGSAVYYFHLGHDGAPRRLSDTAGRIVWMADYGVFGDLLRRDGTLRQPLRFAGQYADDETGLYYNLARYYAPELGRYISRDPLEFASGPNPYLYCYNDPLSGRDPTGLLSGWAKIAVAAAAIAVGVVVIVVAAPVVIAAVAGAAVTASAIGCAGAVVAGAGLVGMGVGLGLAPDGCVACQKKMAIDMGIAFAGAALTGMSIALFPPLAGAGLALAGGGAVGGGSALGLAGVVAGAGALLGGIAHAMSGSSDGGGEDEPQKTNEEKTESSEGKPRGPRAKPHPNDKDPENARALQRQNESADTIAKNGRDVEQLGESNSGSSPGTKHPDFKIDGEPYDNYAPTSGSPRNIASNVADKVNQDQAKRIVLNLDDSPASTESVVQQFKDYPVDGLEDLVIVRNGEMTNVPLKTP